MQEPGIAWHGGTSGWDVSWQWLPARHHLPPRYILHKDGMKVSRPQCSTRHWLDPFERAKFSLSLDTHGHNERELADKTIDYIHYERA